MDHFVRKSLGFPYPPGDQRAKMAEIAEKEMVTRSEHTAPWQPLETLEALGSGGSHGNMSISLRMGCAAPKLWLFNLSENGNILRITENPWELGEPHVQTNP